MRNVYKMTFDVCACSAKWRKRTTVLSGHVDSADVWALDTMRCRGRKRCSFTSDKHMQLVGYDSSHQCSRTHRSRIYPMKLASRLANLLVGPTLTARMHRTCMIWTCNGRDDTPCCAESSLRSVTSVASGLPYFPVAENLSRRDESQFVEKNTSAECHFSCLSLYLYLYLWAGCDLALSQLNSNVSL